MLKLSSCIDWITFFGHVRDAVHIIFPTTKTTFCFENGIISITKYLIFDTLNNSTQLRK